MSGNNLPRIKLIEVVPRQVFTPYNCLLISVAFLDLCYVGGLWVTGMLFGRTVALPFSKPASGIPSRELQLSDHMDLINQTPGL